MIIDKGGDLRLEVGANHRDDPVSFLVCSKTLARRSPIFKTMFLGPFAESSKSADGEWVVQLPDDHPHGFRIVMDIIHSNFAMVPISLEKECLKSDSSGDSRLYEIARMTHKFDMVDVVRPWINNWLEEASLYHISIPEPHFHGQLIWVAWVFGSETILRAELGGVAVSAWVLDEGDDSSDEEGARVDPGVGQPKSQDASRDVCVVDWQDHCTSLYRLGHKHTIFDLLDVSDDIVEVRLQVLQSLLEPVVSLLKQPVECMEVTGGKHIAFYDDGLRYEVVYRSPKYGEQSFMIRPPLEVTPKTVGDLLPNDMIPEAEDYNGSAVELYAQLKDLEDFFDSNIFGYYKHWPDMIDLMGKLDLEFMSRQGVMLRESDIERLRRQRQICGLK